MQRWGAVAFSPGSAVPRTREELERAAAADDDDDEAWLDSLDPKPPRPRTPNNLRRIGLAVRDAAAAAREADEAVVAARANGRSWGEIGMVLGVSRQAARERFGEPANRS